MLFSVISKTPAVFLVRAPISNVINDVTQKFYQLNIVMNKNFNIFLKLTIIIKVNIALYLEVFHFQ